MAHRALVAYERPDNTFSVHYSHSGADRYHLATAITAQTPFGSEESVDQLRELAAVVRDPDTTGRTLPEPDDDQTEWSEFAPPVDLRPQTIDISWDTLLNRTDYLAFEAVYVVTVDWRVNTYQAYISVTPATDAEGNFLLSNKFGFFEFTSCSLFCELPNDICGDSVGVYL